MTPKSSININTLAGRKRAEKYFAALPAKKTEIEQLMQDIFEITEEASKYCHDSSDWYNEGPEDSELTWWEMLDEKKLELMAIVQKDL